MRANTVLTDQSHQPTAFRFSPIFNVAVPFIDRHIEEGRGSRIAVRSVVEDVSYAALADRVSRCGNALLRLGLRPGERLLMVIKDSPEFFYVFWGAIKAGLVPVPLNTLLRAEDYKFFIEDSGCTAVVYSAEFTGEIEAAITQAAHRPRYVMVMEEGEDSSLLAMMGEAPTALKACPANASDQCFWLYSSGSTNRPKGFVHCHRDMVITSQLYGVEVLGIRSDDICFSAAKLYFAYGLGNAMSFPLWAGATAVLLADRPTVRSTFAMIERFKPTLYFGVPTLYAAQIQGLETSKPNLSSVRLCVSAGEALPPRIFQKWRDLTGTVILDGIGSTEALHIFITNRMDEIKPGTSGRVVPGYSAKILDERAHTVRKGEIGQLYIRGGSIAQHYWSHLKRRRCTTNEGWINTGDMFVQDSEGYYIYCGRNDDMLKVNGTWCSPIEIEATLCQHPGVREAAVIGRADADGLIKPEAWIVLNEVRADPATIERELVQHCKSKLPPFQYPTWFHFVSALPRTATGKLQRFKLGAAAGGGASPRSAQNAIVA
jgi:benzoate-CoA ligase family protein